MKAKRSLIIGFLLCATSGFAIQPFQNLNFEAANIPPGTPIGTEFSTNTVIPDWASTGAGFVAYDSVSLGGSIVSINDSMTPLINFKSEEGNYSLILFAGPDGGAADASSISQIGLVPLTAKFILMDIGFPLGSAYSQNFTVMLSGNQITMEPYLAESGYTVYAGNVSAYAGQTEELTITEFPPSPPNVPPSALEVDNILFTANVIPEPSAWELFLCGVASFVAKHVRKNRNPNKPTNS